MEHQKILNLLYESSDSKFVTRKWKIVNGQSNANYSTWNELIFNTEVLKSSLEDYYEVYILVRGNITIVEDNATQVAFKNCAPFVKCITKIDGTAIDIAKDLDLVMLMYNFDTTGSLSFFLKRWSN